MQTIGKDFIIALMENVTTTKKIMLVLLKLTDVGKSKFFNSVFHKKYTKANIVHAKSIAYGDICT